VTVVSCAPAFGVSGEYYMFFTGYVTIGKITYVQAHSSAGDAYCLTREECEKLARNTGDEEAANALKHWPVLQSTDTP
jgi:hypothetical protein